MFFRQQSFRIFVKHMNHMRHNMHPRWVDKYARQQKFSTLSVRSEEATPKNLLYLAIPIYAITLACLGVDFSLINGRYDGSHNFEHERHGHGLYLYTRGIHAGDLYDGEWVHNKKQGHGVLNYKNGDMYAGEFYNDEKHGYGKLTFKNGNVQEGIWEHGEFQPWPEHGTAWEAYWGIV